MTLTEPKVSTAGNFLTMAFFLDILVVPKARTMATIAASPSGMAATANEIAVINISIKSLPCSAPNPKIIKHTTIANKPSILPSSSSFF